MSSLGGGLRSPSALVIKWINFIFADTVWPVVDAVFVDRWQMPHALEPLDRKHIVVV